MAAKKPGTWPGFAFVSGSLEGERLEFFYDLAETADGNADVETVVAAVILGLNEMAIFVTRGVYPETLPTPFFIEDHDRLRGLLCWNSRDLLDLKGELRAEFGFWRGYCICHGLCCLSLYTLRRSLSQVY